MDEAVCQPWVESAVRETDMYGVFEIETPSYSHLANYCRTPDTMAGPAVGGF
jgi:hypothetical protein